MAIDDNTSYELTGAQVKDLASKIKAKADSSSLAAVATSGSYNDLSDKPTIPTVNDGTLTIQQNGTTVGTFTANQSSAATVSLTDTTYSVMTGASSGTAGASGLVPAPAAGDEAKVLSGAGTWVTQSGGGSTYTAGNGISISANNEISIDTSVVAELSDLPTVNDGTLTIQHNGTTKGTFTANQSTASTVNIETATKTSDLTNDGNGTTGSAYVATTDTGTVSTSMIANGAVTNAKIDWSTCNVIIDSSPTASTFFGGSYSKTFTVPKDGYYEISTPFSCVVHRVANAQSALYVAIDSSTKFTYSYMSTSGDTEWGTNRRTIGSTSFIVALTAGQHTLSTSGNLYYDSSISGYTAIGSFYAKYFAPSS